MSKLTKRSSGVGNYLKYHEYIPSLDDPLEFPDIDDYENTGNYPDDPRSRKWSSEQ